MRNETKKKLSDAQKGSTYRFGAHQTKETRQKIRLARTGAHHSEATKHKIRLGRTGKFMSKDSKLRRRMRRELDETVIEGRNELGQLKWLPGIRAERSEWNVQNRD